MINHIQALHFTTQVNQLRAHFFNVDLQLLVNTVDHYSIDLEDMARQQALDADAYARELGHSSLIARTAVELARQDRAMNRHDAAKDNLDRALEHAERADDPRLKIVPLYEQSAIHWSAGDMTGARARLSEAHAQYDEHLQGV